MSAKSDLRIVGFVCDWCSHREPALVPEKGASSVRVVKVGCSGRVDPLLLITAYLRGADGVFVAGCWPGQCHYKDGNLHARRRMALLKDIFETLGLEADRLGIDWISDMEARSLAEIATEFEQRVEQQGPSAARDEIFC